jgi:hypothetical protein
MIRLFRLPLIAALLLVSSACQDTNLPDPEVVTLKPGFNPALIPGNSSGGVALSLVPYQVTRRIGSVQGVLRYDTTRVRLADATVSPDHIGAWREVEPGVIRFAIAAPAGVDALPILTLRFLSDPLVEAGWFRIQLEKIVAVDDYADLAGQVVGGGALQVRE